MSEAQRPLAKLQPKHRILNEVALDDGGGDISAITGQRLPEVDRKGRIDLVGRNGHHVAFPPADKRRRQRTNARARIKQTHWRMALGKQRSHEPR